MTNSRRLFGTDGIRGKANTDPMTAGIALRLGQAAGLLFTRGNHRHENEGVIGRGEQLIEKQQVGSLHLTSRRRSSLILRQLLGIGSWLTFEQNPPA